MPSSDLLPNPMDQRYEDYARKSQRRVDQVVIFSSSYVCI